MTRLVCVSIPTELLGYEAWIPGYENRLGVESFTGSGFTEFSRVFEVLVGVLGLGEV